MSPLRRAAHRKSFKSVPETCPTVRTKINEIFVKNGLPIEIVGGIMDVVAEKGTKPLREAWIEEIQNRMMDKMP
jgi:hypothetical protein